MVLNLDDFVGWGILVLCLIPGPSPIWRRVLKFLGLVGKYARMLCL